ncbi:MAG: hypothetical protein K6E85_16440 [Lachnospiraceae bacterium]|nr:hypothetical protein [Lachnospiraceae bacterium]
MDKIKLEFEGVVVTDDATFIKCFTNPYVQGKCNEQEKGGKFIKKRVLWGEKNRPSAKELITYLHNPDTMDYYLECIDMEFKAIPVFEGYKPIVFQDLVLKENPVKKLLEKHNL